MKKGKVIAMAIISLLALGACSKDNAKEVKVEPTKQEKEVAETNEVTAMDLMQNYNEIGKYYAGIAFALLDNNADDVKGNGEKLDKATKILDKKINNDDIKINKELKADFNNYLKPAKAAAIYAQKLDYDKMSDTGNPFGAATAIIADNYYNGKVPIELEKLSEESNKDTKSRKLLEPEERNTPSNPVTTESTTQGEVEEAPKPVEVPTEYKTALRKAEQYAKVMYMSKAGIYDQLTSEYGEKYAPEAAQYAIDNMQADWNANALNKAKSYQETMSMSPEAIRDQLTSEAGEKFTPEEADYAIQHLND